MAESFSYVKRGPLFEDLAMDLSPSATSNFTEAVRECRKRAALDEIWYALSPVSRHSDAAMLTLELEDFDGLEHHLRHIVEGVRKAAKKHRELRGLLPASKPLEGERASAP